MTTTAPHDHGHDHQHGHDHDARPPRRRERPPRPPQRRPGRRHGAGDRLPRGVRRPRPRRGRRPLRARRLRPLLAREPDGARPRACTASSSPAPATRSSAWPPIGPSQDPDAGGAAGEVTVLAVHPDARRQGHGSRLLNASVDLLREAGAESVTLWLLADDEAARAFLTASGFAPDGAFRDRVVSPDGDTLREVRLATRRRRGGPAGVTADATDRERARTGRTPRCPPPAVARSSARPGRSASRAAPTASASAPSPSPPGSTSGRRRCSRSLMFTGGSQFAFVGIIGAGRPGRGTRGHRDGVDARHPQRALRPADLAPPRRHGPAAARRRPADHRRVDGRRHRPARAAGPAARVLADRASPSSCCGTSRPSPARSSATPSATRARLGLDAAAAAAFVALLWPRLRSRDATATAVLAVFIALLTSPFLPAGVPVILAAAAALVVGLRHPGPPRAAARGRRRRPRRIGPDAMSLWVAVVVACLLSFAIKLAGYLVPESLLAGRAHVARHDPAAGRPARGSRRRADASTGEPARSWSTPGSSPSAWPWCSSCCARTSSSSCSRRGHRRAAARRSAGARRRARPCPTRGPARPGSARRRRRRARSSGASGPVTTSAPASSSRRWKNPGASR